MTFFWLILVIAVLAFVQAGYYAKRGMKRVRYTRSFSQRSVYAGESVELIEVLSNNKLIPLPWVRVESRVSPWLRFGEQENLDISMEQFHKSLFYLGGNSRITRRHQIRCLRRGVYDIGLVSVTAGDLLGLSAATRDIQCDAKIYVYPRILPTDELPDAALKWQGDVTVRRWIMPDPILVTGIRGYRSGDSQKDVHWGATARTGALQVKVRDFTVSPRVLLMFNSQISDNLWGGMEPKDVEFLEGGVSLCAALAAWCIKNGVDVGFTSNGPSRLTGELMSVPPECSPSHLETLLETLAVLEIKMKTDFHLLLEREIKSGATGMDILAVSAYWCDELETRAETLRSMGNSVTFIDLRRSGL